MVGCGTDDAGVSALYAPPQPPGAGAIAAPKGAGPQPASDEHDTCLVQPIDVNGRAPDLLIVMDRSLSMAPVRWVPSVQAVNQLVTQYQNAVDFGLSVFPPVLKDIPDLDRLDLTDLDRSCGKAVLDVPVAPTNAVAVSGALSAMQPGGTTPTAAALASALTFLGSRSQRGLDVAASKPGYVLLVTDGEPNCSTTAIQDSVAAAAALLSAGIKVFVVGYSVSAAAETMNSIAKAGGTERYYGVESPDELDAALRAITKDVVRCDFELATTTQNPNPNFILVTIDGKQISPSNTDGWEVNGRRVTLVGAACETLKDGTIHNLSAELLCEPIR
jgi:von Willebrand factor type A domain